VAELGGFFGEIVVSDFVDSGGGEPGLNLENNLAFFGGDHLMGVESTRGYIEGAKNRGNLFGGVEGEEILRCFIKFSNEGISFRGINWDAITDFHFMKRVVSNMI